MIPPHLQIQAGCDRSTEGISAPFLNRIVRFHLAANLWWLSRDSIPKNVEKVKNHVEFPVRWSPMPAMLQDLHPQHCTGAKLGMSRKPVVKMEPMHKFVRTNRTWLVMILGCYPSSNQPGVSNYQTDEWILQTWSLEYSPWKWRTCGISCCWILGVSIWRTCFFKVIFFQRAKNTILDILYLDILGWSYHWFQVITGGLLLLVGIRKPLTSLWYVWVQNLSFTKTQIERIPSLKHESNLQKALDLGKAPMFWRKWTEHILRYAVLRPRSVLALWNAIPG